tara:strand:- start:2514 stop:2936 length:423 start_codon:yes stop_codon:yes gene_type:complete
LLIYVWGTDINNLYKIFLAFVVAIQPLHSYTTIQLSEHDNSNGFEYLHAELCGTKYSNAISHTQRISDFLDKISTAVIGEMAVDCVCCESSDITSHDLFYLTTNKFLLSKVSITSIKNFYAPNVKTLIPYTNQVRAPPIV